MTPRPANATRLSPAGSGRGALAAAGGGAGPGAPDAAGLSFGHIGAAPPGPEALRRERFRMAIFGDFSGRAARGLVEDLAGRRAIPFDIDTAEQVIAGFATTLALPIGQEGAQIEVPLGGLDDLHPNALHDNVAAFADLARLRQRLDNPATSAAAVAEMTGWGGVFATPAQPARRRSAGASVPADRPLSAFQRLIGDTAGQLSRPSPAGDLIARVVGPHVVAAPDPQAAPLRAAVDEALSGLMRLILHHPEFQSLEAQWRALDLIARRIETDTTLEIVLFDISAEEIATDLAAQDDLAQSGLFGLLTAALEAEPGGFSALFGLWSFEETPPHAELLARLAQIAAHVDAPVFTALSPACLATPPQQRHPLTARAWDALRALPQAAWLGLATPRFLLRRPYGRRSDPIDAFAFEEFTLAEGLSGMLWANPAVAVAILLAETQGEGTGAVAPGPVLSLDDMPFHLVTDRQGDQIALPCTERNLTEAGVAAAVARGLMPLVSVRGRDVVRLASVQSLAGTAIRGPWSNPGAPAPAPRRLPTLEVVMPAGDETLDTLLQGYADRAPAPADPDAIDPELAALLEGL